MCADGRPLSSEIRDALQSCRDLRAMADDHSPFGGCRADVDLKVRDIELLLNTILRAISCSPSH
jgi:hypothetical protein